MKTKKFILMLVVLSVVTLWLSFSGQPTQAATQVEIDQAIQDGLAWLATQQNPTLGYFGGSYLLANTATAVLAFENEGHFPGGGNTYSTNVEQGLDYIFQFCQKIDINPQTYGYSGRNDDPDSNGNGKGIYFDQSSYMYETGLVMQAITASNTPDRIVSGDIFLDITAGGFHSLALKEDGSIVARGYNYYNQTNVPAGNDYVAIAAGLYHNLALKEDGSIVAWGDNYYNQTNAPAGNDYMSIAAGYNHNLALKEDGSIVGWGFNNIGQANAPSGNDYLAIAAGGFHSLALKEDGSIVGWGHNGFLQTNVPAGNDYVAIAAGGFHSLALKEDGSIVGWGNNSYGQASAPVGNDYVAIAAGGFHSLALKEDGSIVAWGYNEYGQASAPAGNDYVAIDAGYYHSLALKENSSIVGWGYNDYGQANIGGECTGMTYQEIMTDLVDFIAWAQIDGSYGRGGWRYGIYNNDAGYADNSVSQWPVLGLIAAEQWGIYAPQWVKDELEYWVTFIQNPDGGSGYHVPNDWSWQSNMSRTGGLLVEFYYLGDNDSSTRVQQALNFVNTHWNEGRSNFNGNKGNPYAMFSVFKGLELLQIPTIPNAPANADTSAGDWWGDYSEYLVNTQNHPTSGLGYWPGYYFWDQYLATPWDIVILQATVFPISVNIEVPGAACDDTGYQVNVHYSVERFTADGTLTVYRDGEIYDTVTLTSFIGSSTQTYTLATEDQGAHTWRAVLDVTGGGIITQAEDTDTSTVYDTPQVSGIPDQTAPFETFDLDNFQTCAPPSGGTDWSVSGVPVGWTVTIDSDSIVTVVAPDGAYEPTDLTFSAVFHWPGIDCEGSDTATFSPNRPPLAHPGKIYPDEKYYVNEGGSVLLDGTQSSDPDGDAITYYAWDLDEDGTFESPGATTTFSAAGLDGPSEVYVYLKVCDEHDACSIGLAEVEIENVAPTIDALTGPTEPVNINDRPVTIEVEFSDPGIPDTHDVIWDWGDESSDLQIGATSPASADHTYVEPGVYTVTVTVTDDDGGSDTKVFEYIVIYDPSAGFVTGGGWIMSPEGAYTAQPDLTGKATFGFVSKYKKGASIPDGNTEFQFRAADFNFHSSSYEWLVVTGGDTAKFKGVGTINGLGEYKFQIWAEDGETDAFRIKIWTEDEDGVETVIYDNGFESSGFENGQPISGGSIVVHDK